MENQNQPISYQEYVNSQAWKEKKQERLDFAMYCCELCSNPNNIEVHHRSYKNLGAELLNDMIVLCETCHRIFHRRLGLYENEADLYRKVESPLDQNLGDTLGAIEEAHSARAIVHGIPTGYTELDNMTGGLQKGSVTVVAGRPGMGTTALVLGLARNAVFHPDRPSRILLVTSEMTEHDLTQRILMSEARVNSLTARTGCLKEDDWPRLKRAAGKLSTAPFYIHTPSRLTISELRNEVRAQCRAYKADLIIIDSLQAIEVPDLANLWREAQVNEIMRVLKGLATDLLKPIIITSRVNQTVERRGGDKRPQLSDLGEDSLVSEADNIFFIYRPEHYGIAVNENGY